MYFKGNKDNPIAFLDVKVLGSVNNSDEMTRELTNIISSELGIAQNNIYISFHKLYLLHHQTFLLMIL